MRFKKHFRSTGRIHILGTGPSLNKDFNDLLKEKRKEDSVLCVNGFATSNLYEIIKPNLYMVTDSSFFKYGVSERVDTFVNDVIEAINKNTQWKMNLIIPINKANSKRLNEITNENIKIYTFSNIPIYGGLKLINVYIYYLNLANPIYQNVLNCALFFAVKTGFDNVYLWGADHDWMNDYRVLSDNKIYAKNRHFYDNGEPEYKLTPIKSIPIEMENESRCFRAYHEIKMYADLKGIKIMNCSSNSMIDAFERKVD